MTDVSVIGVLFSLALAGGITSIGFGIYTIISVSIKMKNDKAEFEARQSKRASPAQTGG